MGGAEAIVGVRDVEADEGEDEYVDESRMRSSLSLEFHSTVAFDGASTADCAFPLLTHLSSRTAQSKR